MRYEKSGKGNQKRRKIKQQNSKGSQTTHIQTMKSFRSVESDEEKTEQKKAVKPFSKY